MKLNQSFFRITPTNPKDILVTTTSFIEGLQVKQYLKPISAHIVAGTNIFSDFFADIRDVIGGRSKTYQKQLISLYNEAIERLKVSAYEIGANCIVGLNIDFDEISGKGKAMFMLTAIGTAVIIENNDKKENTVDTTENVGIDRIETLKTKRQIIEKANAGTLSLDDEIWHFITSNQVQEVYNFILVKLQGTIDSVVFTPKKIDLLYEFYEKILGFIDSLPEEKKIALLYASIIKEDNELLALWISKIIKDLQLLDLNHVTQILQDENFQKQKRGLRILTYDKPFYNKQDVEKFKYLVDLINNKFKERMKKRLPSSEEIWTCECGETIALSSCSFCNQDINGFKNNEVTALNAVSIIEEKISLIAEYVK